MTGNVRMTGLIAAALVLAGCAANAPRESPRAERAAMATDDSSCSTATRIPAAGAKCSDYGRRYSYEDIRRTGATTVGDALALLDPSITVHR